MKSLPRRSVVRRPSLRRSNPAIAFACEPVERRLLLASVSGTVFHDVNANGVQDLSEAYQSGFRIYADLNHNGQFDADEPSAVSNNFGQWKIDGLPAGKYLIREEPRAGFTKFPLTPSAGFYHVVLPTDDSSVENLEFGNARFASASGRVFFDTWGNGKEDGPDTGLAGITVFIDANDNGVLDPGEVSKQTNADGEFRIEYIRPGFTRVRIIVPPDLHASTRDQYGFVFPSNFQAQNLNFGLTNVGEIRGRVFSDANGDTFQSRTESGVANRLVFLDYNGNGVHDPGEAAVLTNASGDYVFRGLKPGRYRVTVQPSPQAEISRPTTGKNFYSLNLQPSQVRENINFGLAPRGGISGFVYGDHNANGTPDATERGIGGRIVFIDLNNNGVFDANEPNVTTSAEGYYEFRNLPSGRYGLATVIPNGQYQTTPVARRNIVDVQAGKVTSMVNFGVALQGYITGTLFSDRDGDRVFDIDEPRLANRRVYIDVNNDGVWQAGEPSTFTNELGEYVLGGLEPGEYIVRAVAPAGAAQTKPAASFYRVFVRPGTVARNHDFGFSLFASMSGTVYTDLDADGTRDGGEPGRNNVTVFIDVNTNGVLDPGEPTTTTDVDGSFMFAGLSPGTYRVRVVPPAGYAVSQPGAGAYTIFLSSDESRQNLNFGLYETASVSGVVYNDVNEDGSLDGGDTPLAGRVVFLDLDNDGVFDLTEPSETTDANGEYTFSGLRPGTYTVAILTNAGETITEPLTGSYTINPTSGQVLVGRDFGLTVPAGIFGTVWSDENGDGNRDPGDDGIAGETVFIDVNDDGVQDVVEPSDITDANGNYSFLNLPPGNYKVRLVVQAGDQVMTPVGAVHTIAVASGTPSTGNDFGVVKQITISGLVYADLDGNGSLGVGEDGLENIVVFLDEDGDGVLDPTEWSELTDAAGLYVFTGVAPGTYDIYVIPPGAETITQPVTGFYTVIATSGDSHGNNDFGLN